RVAGDRRGRRARREDGEGTAGRPQDRGAVMRRRRQLERSLAEARVRAVRPRYLRIRAEVLIHDRVEVAPGPECPCCRSVDARIVERRPLDDLVIDLETGERIRERDLTPAAWRELCEVADLRELPLRL